MFYEFPKDSNGFQANWAPELHCPEQGPICLEPSNVVLKLNKSPKVPAFYCPKIPKIYFQKSPPKNPKQIPRFYFQKVPKISFLTNLGS